MFRFSIFSNGTIHSSGGFIYSEEHCLDGVQNFDNGGQIQPQYSGNHKDHVVLGVCISEDVFDNSSIPSIPHPQNVTRVKLLFIACIKKCIIRTSFRS
jgi:hypothetical protein